MVKKYILLLYYVFIGETMPKAGSKERIEKYEIKRTTTMPVAYEKMVKERKPAVEKLGARAEIDEKVSGILNAHGVPGNFRIPYHNFARIIDRHLRNKTLVPKTVEAEMAKFEALGCDRTILEEIVKTLTGASA